MEMVYYLIKMLRLFSVASFFYTHAVFFVFCIVKQNICGCLNVGQTK